MRQRRNETLDHTRIAVADFNRCKAFYERALSPLSIVLVMEVTAEQSGGGAHAGFGTGGKPLLWIGDGGRLAGQVHIAFTARSRAEVAAFHRAGLDAGGKNNGAPGLRPHYHANYYGAFILDPDGNNIEAVCHEPV
jgi:catechol 2,3-dioxygenase-like lactoylglutathione lyase family enzyme